MCVSAFTDASLHACVCRVELVCLELVKYGSGHDIVIFLLFIFIFLFYHDIKYSNWIRVQY